MAGWPTTACRTRAEAERLNAVRLTTAPPCPSDGRTVGDLVDLVVAAKAGLSKGGRGSISAGAGHVRTMWGSTPPGDVTPWEVEAWLAGLRVRADSHGATRPASAETKIKALQVLKEALDIAVTSGQLPANPLAGVTVRRRNPRDPRILTAAELGKLADAAGAWSPMIWLMGTAGPRIGETVALDVGDIDTRRLRLRVHASKGGRARDVPVPTSVIAMLDLERPASDPLFIGERGGRLRADNWRRRVFGPACVRAGMEGLVPHDLRHTAASLMVASGASVKDVQAALGHRSARMTLDVYAGRFDGSLDVVGQRMDSLLTRTKAVPGCSD